MRFFNRYFSTPIRCLYCVLYIWFQWHSYISICCHSIVIDSSPGPILSACKHKAYFVCKYETNQNDRESTVVFLRGASFLLFTYGDFQSNRGDHKLEVLGIVRVSTLMKLMGLLSSQIQVCGFQRNSCFINTDR